MPVHVDTLTGTIPFQLWARHKAAIFPFLATIVLLSPSILYCLAAVIKVLFHLPWLLQPLSHWAVGNLRHMHGGHCPAMVTVFQKTPVYCHCQERGGGFVQ